MKTDNKKHHFHVYDVNPVTRNKFLVLCKMMSRSGSRVVEGFMEKFIKDNAKKLNG